MIISATFRAISAVAIMLLAASSGVAQYAGELGQGQTVRVQVGSKRFQGTLVRLQHDSLAIVHKARMPGGGREYLDTATVARSSISQLWVSTRESRSTVQGMGVGLLVVGTVGAVIGAVTYEPCEPHEFLDCLLVPPSRADAALLGGMVGGFLGLVIGAVAGQATHRYDWQEVPLHVTASPSPGYRARIAVRLTLGR